MNSIIGKLLASDCTEYIAVAHDWLILETSSGVQRFANCPEEVIPGKDVRLGFPELRGYENSLINLEESQNSFELKGIVRFKKHSYLFYIDLYITHFDLGFIILLKEVTERIILEEKLAENNREVNLLLSALSAAYSYIDKIFRSIKDVLFVTTQSGNIITVNQAALELFEYSQEELILKPISTIIVDENFLLRVCQQHHPSKSDFLKDCEVVCHTKTTRKLIVTFSVVQTEIEGLQHFVYIGKDITQRQRTQQLQDVEHATTRILANSTTLFEAMANILSSICSSLGWELGEFWSVDRQANVLRLSSNWQMLSDNFPKCELVSQQITFSPEVGLPGRVWASGQPVWINDVVQDENFLQKESVVTEDLHGAFGFPIKCGSEITGVMSFFSRKIQEEQSDLLKMMAVIGSQIDQFILRSQVEAALRESEERFQAFMNNSPAVAFMKDSEGRFVYINKTLERNFNVKQADLQGKTDFDWLPEETAQQVRENDRYVLSTGKTAQIIETIPTPDGCLHHWLSLRFPFTDAQGRQLVGGVAVDITERKLLEQELFEEKELAQVTLKSIGDAVITTDAFGQVKYLNPVAEELTEWTLQDAQGKPLAEVFRVVNETTRETVENPVEKALGSGGIVSLAKDTILITRNGAEIAIDDSAAPIRAKSGEIVGAVMVFQDVSQTRGMARQLSWQATHDALTGLFNRCEFERRLELALSNAKTQNLQHVLCYLDLDRFKIVNDTCGHIAGDELLRQVTTLLQTLVRSSDTLARLGGDEFAMLLEVCPLEAALRIANTVLQRIQEFRFVWLNKTFNIGVSIGLVVINLYNSQSMNSVLSAGDAACYVAKNKGRHRVHIYQEDDGDLAKAQGEMQWVARIAQALEENRFCLYYQPIVPTKPNEASGEHYEVLLRLIDEKGDIVSPMAFIPAAERYNLMQAIDRWVIRTFFTSLALHGREKSSLQERNCNCLYAINLSGASINDDQFMDFLREQLTLHQIPPQTICFEITETIAVANLGKAAILIRSLRELGCRFALDDFGSGMSSFSYLKNLPVDYLKIDGSFVKHIVEEPIDLAMVEAINQIGHVMGIQTIAEFVENEEIFEKIKLLGVDYAQGYGIAKPRPFT